MHVEDAAGAGQQLDTRDLALELIENLRRQTDGVRAGASGNAVLDADRRALGHPLMLDGEVGVRDDLLRPHAHE